MRCYIINLDRAPQRMERMVDLLASSSSDFIRCPAIDAKQFTAQELDNYRSRRLEGKPLSGGDIACSESHLAVYRQILEGTDEYAVVMEDDIHLSNDAGDFINRTDWIPAGAEIIKLETVDEPTLISSQSIRSKNNRELVQLHYTHWGSGAYVISKTAARKMLAEYIPGAIPFDHYLFNPSSAPFPLWQLHPAIAIQDIILTRSGEVSANFLASELAVERNKMPKPQRKQSGLTEIINRETRRIVRRLRKRIMYSWAINISRTMQRKKIPFRA